MNNMTKCPKKKCTSAICCVLAGLASGIALGIIGKILLDTNKKALKKKADKMISAMSDLSNSAMEMFK